MKRTTLINALEWVAPQYGLSLTEERDDAILLVNRILEEASLEFPDISYLNDVEECFQIQEFRENCHDCETHYHGITLPSYIEHVTAAWLDDMPVAFFSKWREYVEGREFHQDYCETVKLYDVPGSFSTERDIIGGYDRVMVKSTMKEAKGLKVIMVIGMPNGEEKRISLELSDEWKTTEDELIEIKDVVLPTGRKGGVILAQERNQRVLSEYNPKEHVPSMKRLKIIASCCNKPLRIFGQRCHTDVYYDTDIIPIGSRRFFENGAAYFKLLDDGSTNDVISRAASYRELMVRALRNLVELDKGVGKSDPLLWTRKHQGSILSSLTKKNNYGFRATRGYYKY